MHTLFFRLLNHEDKAAALGDAISAVREGREANTVVHAVDPASFRQVPGSPYTVTLKYVLQSRIDGHGL
jgi:hypothetical protein